MKLLSVILNAEGARKAASVTPPRATQSEGEQPLSQSPLAEQRHGSMEGLLGHLSGE